MLWGMMTKEKMKIRYAPSPVYRRRPSPDYGRPQYDMYRAGLSCSERKILFLNVAPSGWGFSMLV
ncbi:hypothetical protein DY000_02002580 [Brassica cretica]|uniref:Uncharacterized protein n=1 Tax=Brassica cretica TaxID=69181 RepID=A0ABQ7C510_BRACR|nr:hypothetical protein DY000_02002580 [Brassica cretica]